MSCCCIDLVGFTTLHFLLVSSEMFTGSISHFEEGRELESKQRSAVTCTDLNPDVTCNLKAEHQTCAQLMPEGSEHLGSTENNDCLNNIAELLGFFSNSWDLHLTKS